MHVAQLMPLPLTVSCFSRIHIGFTFLVPAHPGSPDKGPLNGRLCVGCNGRCSVPQYMYAVVPENSSLAWSMVLGYPSSTNPWFWQGLEWSRSRSSRVSSWSSMRPPCSRASTIASNSSCHPRTHPPSSPIYWLAPTQPVNAHTRYTYERLVVKKYDTHMHLIWTPMYDVQCRLYLHWGPGHPPAERGPSLKVFAGFPLQLI